MSSPLVQAQGVYKIFGRGAQGAVERLKQGASRDELRDQGLTAAVIDASFEVEPGEIFVVMGLSGSGKSTLIRLVNGLLTPTSGDIVVAGENISHLSPKQLRRVCQERVSMVFQHFALFPHRTVGENAAYGLEVRGSNKTERFEKATEALSLVGLEGWEQSLPGELSGGMRQRVGLARALATGTELLLMDEAFSALDPLIRREMQDQLIDLQQRLGRTVIFITHDLNEAMRMGDRIAMMRDGKIVQVGTAEQILNDPANDYVAQFVQDVDRSRILTAENIMERPAALLGSEQGPRTAHKLMRENQLNHLFVVDRNRRLVGTVIESDVAAAVDRGESDLRAILVTTPTVVSASTALADLLADSAVATVPLAVIAEDQRLLGVIPKVTLLNALSVNSNGNGNSNGTGTRALAGASVGEL
ncbi:MAG TPA: glycine betaine/L-proline ABC transporter ATP-binding protein [Microthrixaceae bacterium]|nr:glycine betaine/L-proline ABC transporter ATP-binding protein [Microthrixaceae bacterium]